MTRPQPDDGCWWWVKRTDSECKKKGDWRVAEIPHPHFCRQHALMTAQEFGMNHIWHSKTGEKVELPLPEGK